MFLEVEAAAADQFSITASGRNADVCSSLTGNLLLETYANTLSASGAAVCPLALQVANEIPLGMGCGSSAAVRLAGVSLAAHYGGLGWTRQRILDEASMLEGHPDNTAACWLGGFTVATLDRGEVHALSMPVRGEWRILLVMPCVPLATSKARAVLPGSYSREDAVANVQRSALLTAAFAMGRGDLLRWAMEDRLHQPYRGEICPLLPLLLPLAGKDGILGVALSGAGPAVLMVIESQSAMAAAIQQVTRATRETPGIELLDCGIEANGAGCY